MADSQGDIVLAAVVQGVLEDEGGRVGVPGKGVDISNAASSRYPQHTRRRTPDRHANSPALVGAARVDEVAHRGLLGGNVDFKGEKIFRHTLKDALDAEEFFVAKGWIGVDAESRRLNG